MTDIEGILCAVPCEQCGGTGWLPDEAGRRRRPDSGALGPCLLCRGGLVRAQAVARRGWAGAAGRADERGGLRERRRDEAVMGDMADWVNDNGELSDLEDEAVRDPIVSCPYCGAEAELIGGEAIYPSRPELRGKWFYRCAPCGAHVGCHPGTERPLGRLADARLRRARAEAHRAFDPIWRKGRRTRSEAYAWLAGELGVPVERCHVGLFDLETCRVVVAICERDLPGWVRR